MSIVKTPQEKKRLSLKRDHPLLAEYPHGFRKSWPRKRRRAQQTFRHKVKQDLNPAKGTMDSAIVERLDPERNRRKKIPKWSSRPLGQVIKEKKERRIFSYRRKKNARLELGDT
ncbi:MAG: hypothetical protein HY748_04265 [Elusimicrobia bacterium]|nr:hypothetical protein [Elusimicrobiota bacterium]